MHTQHVSIGLQDFEGGEWLDEVVVQVSAVGALLNVAVLREILHPYADIHHWFPTVLTVQSGLGRQGGGGGRENRGEG